MANEFKVKNGLITTGIVSASELTSTLSSGPEGGQINLAKPVTDTLISDGVIIDVYQNKLRFFERGGSFRGFYIDITAGGASVGTNLVGGGGGSGTVTSVTGTGTVSGLTLTGTVTTSGNITLGGTLSVSPSNFSSQTANTFLAAPNGTAGTPTFRAIAAADIPVLNQNTTGTAANVTGTVAVANGGTGTTTLTANSVVLGNGTSAVQTVAPGASGNVLTSNGTTWVSSAPTGSGGGGGSGYSVTIGNGSATSFTVTHNLNTANIIVSVRENITNGYIVYPDIKYTGVNTIVIEFASAPTTNQYLVCVMGF